MKKAISVIIILLIGILSVSSISYAATLQATLDITVDKQEVDAGGEYVTFNLKIKDKLPLPAPVNAPAHCSAVLIRPPPSR